MSNWKDQTTARPRPKPRKDQAVPTLRVVFLPERAIGVHPARELCGEVPLGRGVEPSAGIALEDATASRLHGVVKVDGTRAHFTDRSRNGSFLNGQRVQQAELRDGDVLRLGDVLLVYRVRPADEDDFPLPELTGMAPSMLALRCAVERAATGSGSVLILGETGTGKELVARALHEGGRQTRGPFVAVNTSAIPEQLAESHLFGHVAGAFSGAHRDHPGVFRAADGGTLFLDEIGDLPLAQQPKLLRALESGEVMPVGAAKAVRTSGRVVAATNLALSTAVQEGRFRGDLFARLSAHVIHTPALRERREDILPLFAGALPSGLVLDPDLAEALLVHPWPFNVREVLQLARHAMAHTEGGRLRLGPLADRLSRPSPTQTDVHATESEAPGREQLESLLAHTQGQVTAMARILGRSRRQVYRYLEAHGLDVEGFR